MNKDGAIERIRELVDAKVPFLHQGRSFAGMDCIGALEHAFQYKGWIPDYSEDPVNGELERALRKILGAPFFEFQAKINPLKSPEVLQPIDILTMQYRGPTRHVALVVPHISIPNVLSIVHTDAMLGRVTEHILDHKWLRRVTKVWRP